MDFDSHHDRLTDLERRVQALEQRQDHHTEIMQALYALGAKLDNIRNTIMADAASVLAKVTASTDMLKSVAIAADALKEGQATIADEIKALKDQIAAAGTPVDFGPLDAAADEQAAVIAGLKTAIPANT